MYYCVQESLDQGTVILFLRMHTFVLHTVLTTQKSYQFIY